jgi:hypothetical protein
VWAEYKIVLPEKKQKKKEEKVGEPRLFGYQVSTIFFP